MYSHYNYKYEREVVILHPGEYYASGENHLISTVLGSCVAVVLYDEGRRIGGMNHYMLPGKFADLETGDRTSREHFDDAHRAKLGVYAMQMLIARLIDAGADRWNLQAKVFGGGNVLGNGEMAGGKNSSDIGSYNVELAFAYLEREQIPVVSSDVRGYVARKIFLEPRTGYVYLKRLEKKLLEPVRQIEQSVIEELEKKPSANLFDLFNK
jgi:chemotaxis protein CheD